MLEFQNHQQWQRWVPTPIRLILGVGFVVHGWAKWSPAAFAQLLKQAHVPLPLANARISDLVSFEPDIVSVHLDGPQLHLEPGQTVFPHGPDRDLDVPAATGKQS